ncbi:MAG: HlyD family secretion protein [Candidatus Eremiobacteraeota bacterium]|nr:HlyD family secretion protein [Candidatus Eremiobacteraeota bacterium]
MSEQQEPKPRRNPIGWLIMLVVIIAGAAYGLHAYHLSQLRQVTDNAQIEGAISPISARVSGQVTRVAVIENQQVKEGDLLFEIDPREYQARVDQIEGELASAQSKLISARLQVQLARETSQASLLESSSAIDVTRQQVVAAQRAADVAAAQLEQTSSAIAQARSGIKQNQAALEAAQTEAARLQEDSKRYAQLFSKREISEQQFKAAQAAAVEAAKRVEQARQGVHAARANLDSAQSGRQVAARSLDRAQASAQEMEARIGQAQGQYEKAETTRTQVVLAESSVKAAEAEVKRLKAVLDKAKLDLSHTRVLAPITGRVARKNVQPGQVVNPGAPVLALVDESDLWVIANFKETQMEKIRVDQKAEVVVDAYPDQHLEGRVQSIQPGTGAIFSLLPPENASGNFVKVVQRIPVKIVLDTQGQELPLHPGMSVEATIWLQ